MRFPKAVQSGVVRVQRVVRTVGQRLGPRFATSIAAFACGAVAAVPLVLDQPAALASAPFNDATTVNVVTTATMLASNVSFPSSAAVSHVLNAQRRDELASESSSKSDGLPAFNGRPVRATKTITMKVTAYSPDAKSCGDSADGITASGYSVWTNGGRMVAADTSILPLGSLIAVPGYDAGAVVPVLDRGGAIKGNRLDVLFPTHEAAREWGVRDIKVTVYEYADGKPNDFRPNHWRR